MSNYKLNKEYQKFYLKKVGYHFINKWTVYLRALILIAILITLGDRLNIWYFKPSKLYTLLDRFFYDYAKEHPEVLTKTKAFKWPYISSGSEGKLNDVSTFQVEFDSLYVQKEYEFLDRYNLNEMTADEQLSAKTFRYIIEQEILEKLLFKNTKFPIDHVQGIQVQLPMFMLNCHTINSTSDAKNYISRLIDAQDKISELITGNKLNPKGTSEKITTKNILFRRSNESLEEAIHHFHVNDALTIPPKNVLNKVKEQLKVFLSTPVEENIFYVDFINKLDNLEGEELLTSKRELKYELKKAIEGAVIPSFDALYRTVSELEIQAPEEITSMQYKFGELYYQHCLRASLGMNDAHLDYHYRPKNLYFLGKKELSKETRKLHELLDSANIASGSLRERIDIFATKELQMTHHEYMMLFEDTFMEFEKESSKHYPIEIGYYPSLAQGTFIEPFYYEGSFDNTRKSKIFFSDSISLYSKIVVKPTAIAYQNVHQWSNSKLLNPNLPLFRRGLSMEYITEFWKNVSIYKHYNNADLHQRIRYQLWKVHQYAFMVCDLGIHHYLWTKKEAVEYVYDKSILSVSESENIVDFSTSSIGYLAAKGFGVHLLNEYLKNKHEDFDSQLVMAEMQNLFKEGAVSFSEFKDLMFVNKSEK